MDSVRSTSVATPAALRYFYAYELASIGVPQTTLLVLHESEHYYMRCEATRHEATLARRLLAYDVCSCEHTIAGTQFNCVRFMRRWLGVAPLNTLVHTCSVPRAARAETGWCAPHMLRAWWCYARCAQNEMPRSCAINMCGLQPQHRSTRTDDCTSSHRVCLTQRRPVGQSSYNQGHCPPRHV